MLYRSLRLSSTEMGYYSNIDVLDKSSPQSRPATRTAKAAGICERQECELRDDGRWQVRDSATGSGTWHIVTATSCDCMDYRRTGLQCKHLLAVTAEQARLDAYVEEWNAAAESMQPKGAWYKGTYYTAEQCAAAERARAANEPVCPTCGAATQPEQVYVGGRGYVWFASCRKNHEHRAVRTP